MKTEKENKASYFSVGKEIYHYRFEIAVLNLELGVIRLNSEVQFSLSGRKRQGAVASMLFSFRQERGALMSSYTHLTHEERYQIYALKKPASLRQPQGIDALYLDASTSLFYFTGLRLWATERLHGAVIPARGELIYITPGFEEEKTRAMLLFGDQIRTWEEHEDPTL